MRAIRLALLPIAFFALSAAADPGVPLRTVIDDFIIPRFRTVAQTTAVQERAWQSFCADRAHGDVGQLRLAYGEVADAWANIEFVRIGPAGAEMRAERFNWWLDRADTVGHALNAMLVFRDAPAAAKISEESAAQGLPILERLLYPDDALARLRGDSGAWRCAIGEAVAGNVDNLAQSILADWVSPAGARAAIVANRRWKYAFIDDNEAGSVLLTDLVAGLENLHDNKLGLMLRDAMHADSPPLAEDARSGRSLRDAMLNLAGIERALAPFLTHGSAAQNKQLNTAFDEAMRSLGAIAAAKNGGERVVQLRAAMTALARLEQTARHIVIVTAGEHSESEDSDDD